MQKLIATWNTARGVWEKPTGGGLLCEHSEPYSETWPTSGIMLNGQAYEQPTPELPTIGTEFSFSPGGGARVSVPTPVVSDVWADGYERAITKESPNRGVGLPTWANRMALLRTPNASDGAHSGPNQRDSSGYPSLSGQLRLLRTPTAAEVDGGPVHPDVAKAKGQTLRLTGQVLALLPTPNTQEGSGKCRDYRANLTHAITCDCKNWGDFTPAIERWEQVTNRKAPEPTLPDGQKGQHRLSAKFTEWLMGLPDGWITGHGLHRKDAIKMAGNGVVPQQAKLALTILREGL